MKLIIDRARWLRGEGGHDSYLLSGSRPHLVGSWRSHGCRQPARHRGTKGLNGKRPGENAGSRAGQILA